MIKTLIISFNYPPTIGGIETYAKELNKFFFDKKDIAYEDIMVDMDQEQLRIMMEKSKRQSVPQIFIGDYHVGGFDDLIEHDMDGKLEDLLKD